MCLEHQPRLFIGPLPEFGILLRAYKQRLYVQNKAGIPPVERRPCFGGPLTPLQTCFPLPPNTSDGGLIPGKLAGGQLPSRFKSLYFFAKGC